jgi:hypothetical protein
MLSLLMVRSDMIGFFTFHLVFIASAALLRRAGGRAPEAAASLLKLYVAAMTYFGTWVGQRERIQGGRVSAPRWIRFLARLSAPDAVVDLTLAQVWALGFVTGALLGAALGIPEREQWLWGVYVGLATAAAVGIAWWVWLQRKAE